MEDIEIIIDLDIENMKQGIINDLRHRNKKQGIKITIYLKQFIYLSLFSMRIRFLKSLLLLNFVLFF